MSTSRWRHYTVDPHNRTYKLPWPSRYRVAGSDVQLLFRDYVLGAISEPLSQNIKTCFQPRGIEIMGLSRAYRSGLIRRLAAERMRLVSSKTRMFYNNTTYLCPIVEHTTYMADHYEVRNGDLGELACPYPREPPLPCYLHKWMKRECSLKTMGLIWRQWILVPLGPPEEGRVRTRRCCPRPWGAVGEESLFTTLNPLLWYHVEERGVPQPAFLRAWAEKIGWT